MTTIQQLSMNQKIFILGMVRRLTKSTPKVPKNKYVQIVVDYTNQKDNAQMLIWALRQRLRKNKLIVILKTLNVFHHCMTVGDDTFIKLLKNRRNYFDLQKYHPCFISANNYLSVFITKFAKYLSVKISVYNAFGSQFEKKRNITSDSNIQDTIKKISYLQNQFNALCNSLTVKMPIRIQPCLQNTRNLLIKDGALLYSILYDGVIALQDYFWKEGSIHSAKILKITKNFLRETKTFRNIFQKAYGKSVTRPEINFYTTYNSLFTEGLNLEKKVKSMEKKVEEMKVEFDIINFDSKNDKAKKPVNKKKKNAQLSSESKNEKARPISSDDILSSNSQENLHVAFPPKECLVFKIQNPFENQVNNRVPTHYNPFL